MGDEKQIQKAGDNSQQIQAGTVIINNGITEERARDIFMEMSKRVISETAFVAGQIAEQKIRQFEDIFIPKMQESDFSSFKEPAFQHYLFQAQKAAALSAKETDYDLLADLITSQVENKNNLKNRTGISHAIDILPEIDNSTLCALTVSHSLDSFVPNEGRTLLGLCILDNFYSKVLIDSLPYNVEWIDQLDILKAIRIDSTKYIKRLSEFIPKKLNGYVCIGIEKDSDNYCKAIEILKTVQLPEDTLIQNELLKNYYRLPVSFLSANQFEKIDFVSSIPPVKFDQLSALKQIEEMYSTDNSLMQEVQTSFWNLWNTFDSLRTVKAWWEAIPQAFEITLVGKTLAHVNAKRCYTGIPDLK